jgi:hypothetical protein
MAWHSVQLAGTQPMNVFHCGKCDMLAVAVAKNTSSAEGESKFNNKAQS